MVSNFGGKWAPLQGKNLLAGPSFVAPKQAGSLGSPAYHFLAPLAVAEWVTVTEVTLRWSHSVNFRLSSHIFTPKSMALAPSENILSQGGPCCRLPGQTAQCVCVYECGGVFLCLLQPSGSFSMLGEKLEMSQIMFRRKAPGSTSGRTGSISHSTSQKKSSSWFGCFHLLATSPETDVETGFQWHLSCRHHTDSVWPLWP